MTCAAHGFRELASVIDRHGKIMEKGMGQIASPHWGDIALAIAGIVTLVLGILAFAWGWGERGRRDRRDQGDDPSNGGGDAPLIQ
jgi:hypothetical protein